MSPNFPLNEVNTLVLLIFFLMDIFHYFFLEASWRSHLTHMFLVIFSGFLFCLFPCFLTHRTNPQLNSIYILLLSTDYPFTNDCVVLIKLELGLSQLHYNLLPVFLSCGIIFPCLSRPCEPGTADGKPIFFARSSKSFCFLLPPGLRPEPGPPASIPSQCAFFSLGLRCFWPIVAARCLAPLLVPAAFMHFSSACICPQALHIVILPVLILATFFPFDRIT